MLKEHSVNPFNYPQRSLVHSAEHQLHIRKQPTTSVTDTRELLGWAPPAAVGSSLRSVPPPQLPRPPSRLATHNLFVWNLDIILNLIQVPQPQQIYPLRLIYRNREYTGTTTKKKQFLLITRPQEPKILITAVMNLVGDNSHTLTTSRHVSVQAQRDNRIYFHCKF